MKYIVLAVLTLYPIPYTLYPASAANPQYLFELSYSEAQEAIGRALAEKGAGGKISATINGGKYGALFSYKQPIHVEIRGLQFDKRSSRWSASLICLTEGQVVTAIPAEGRFTEMIEAPVLKREMRNGDIIKQEDIELRDFPLSHTRGDTVTDSTALIGKSPARSVSPGRPMRAHEIASPTLVRKNALVQMRYVSPGMEITAGGQAMTDGAKGDVISVRNTDSKKVLRAIVQDENTVHIVAPGTQTSEMTGASYATN